VPLGQKQAINVANDTSLLAGSYCRDRRYPNPNVYLFAVCMIV
jgi:hypothetical protein